YGLRFNKILPELGVNENENQTIFYRPNVQPDISLDYQKGVARDNLKYLKEYFKQVNNNTTYTQQEKDQMKNEIKRLINRNYKILEMDPPFTTFVNTEQNVNTNVNTNRSFGWTTSNRQSNQPPPSSQSQPIQQQQQQQQQQQVIPPPFS